MLFLVCLKGSEYLPHGWSARSSVSVVPPLIIGTVVTGIPSNTGSGTMGIRVTVHEITLAPHQPWGLKESV